MRYLEALAAAGKALGPRRTVVTSLGMTEMESEKPESEISIRVFKLLPRRCRLGGSPVPFGNGRTTVARASDFQLRHAMFPRRDQASLLMKYRFGNLTCISNNAG